MNKTVKILASFVLLFAIAAAGFTYFSIEKAKESAKMEEVIPQTTETPAVNTEAPTEAVPEPVEKPIDLYGTYDTNDIVISEAIDKKGEAEVRYPEIEGLRNKAVQDKINADLRKNMDELLAKYDTINYANFYTRANFANVLSISLHIGNDDKYEQKYLNYELVNGNEILLEDLFMRDTDILSIVRDSFYKSSASENWYMWEGQATSPDENAVYKAVKSYMEDDVKDFSFTPSEICFYTDKRMASAKMIDHYDEISIYSKYLTEESIYENDDIGYEDIFTCADCSYEPFEIIDYGYGEENLWYDLTVWKLYDSEIDEERLEKVIAVNKQVQEEIYEIVEEYKDKARNNKDKFYIVMAKPGYYVVSASEYIDGQWNYEYSDTMEISSNIQIFEMPIELYESRYRDEIIDTYRYQYFAMRGGAYLDTENLPSDVQFTKIDGTKLVNYTNGNNLVVFSDIFKDCYDYMSFIKAEVTRNYIDYGYSQAEAEEMFNSAEIKLKGGNVEVKTSAFEYPYSISISQFDKSQLKIFGQEE